MVKHLFLVLLSVQFTFACLGQGSYKPPKIPERYVTELNLAVSKAQVGKTEEAISLIKEIIAKYPTWLEPRHNLSRIYYEAGYKKESVAALEQSIAIDSNSQVQQLYTLARLYEETSEFQKAIHTYNTVIRKGIHNASLAQRASASLEALEEKSKLLESNYSITLLPLAEGINSKEHEALGRWTVDGRQVIFTRFIYDQEDLYVGHLDKNEELISVEEMPFNTDLNEGGHTISPDGKYLVYTSCDRREGMGSCDLYLSVLKDGMWTTPVNMGPGFNSESWDSQPSFGLDGQSIWFTSTRRGGYGGSDIWMVHEISRGKWSKPINAGPEINTSDNEESPFIYFDGRSIYFMRDGDDGIGGYDLYFSRMGLDGKWQKPVNMGFPINSPSDEGALALHPDGIRAMITRDVAERKNELFSFNLPPQFQSSPVQVLKVTIHDHETKKPVRAQMEIFQPTGKDTLRVSQLSDENGIITMTLERNQDYGLIAGAENYIMHSSHLPADSSAMRELHIDMIPIAKAANKAIVLENIFFETGSSKLLPSSNPELNRLLRTLEENPSMKIEIRGHTDHVGTDADNLKLSDDRAKAVYQYLIDKGIQAERLSFKGFGETQPVADNESAMGRQKNRRTEFVILL